jgi:Arc/MetJ-type ribon-helix-helix transcriptional regulator
MIYINNLNVDVNKTQLVTLHVPDYYINGLERLIEAEIYPNRSEAIRVAIRDLLKTELGSFTPETTK